MIRGSSTGTFLANVDLLNQQATAAQERMSSGYRVNRASDDPSSVADILRLTAEINSAGSQQQDLGRVKSEVDSGESAMESAVNLMQSAVGIASDGASSTSDTKRATLASQVGQIIEQMVNLSSTTSDGRYIFSGDSDGQPTYSLVGGQAKQLMDPTNTRIVQGPGGAQFSVSKTATELFGDSFTALQQLQTALTNNDQTAISQASDSVKSAFTSVNDQLAFYGDAQTRVSAATDLAAKYETQWKVELSGVRDSDVASDAVEIQTINLHMQAAMQAESKRPQSSLFDYLK